jgi:predicted enzyme related to lactoylglutathione lyase
MRRHGPGPVDMQAVNSYVCTINVSNLDEYAGKVTANGGINVLPRMAVPGVGWLAYYKDTQGNIFGMMQNDPNAK